MTNTSIQIIKSSKTCQDFEFPDIEASIARNIPRFNGRSCLKCIQGYYDKPKVQRNSALWCPVALWGSPFTLVNARDYLQKIRQNRFFIRANTGMLVYQSLGVPLRTFTLSESPEAESLGLHFGKSIHRLMTRFVQVYGEVEYFWVEHKPRAGEAYYSHKGSIELSQGRYNRHIVVAGGSMIDKEWLESEWQRIYKSQTSGLSMVKKTSGYAFYLSNYLTKGDEEFRRCRFSKGWIFEGWFPFEKEYKKRKGEYPSVDLLARMSECYHGVVKKLRGYPPEVKLESLFLLASEVE